MPKEKLTKLVNELSKELEEARHLDDSDKRLLQDTVTSINGFLNSSFDKSDQEEILTSVDKLEVEHPVIMGIVKKIMDTLNSMGV